MRIRRGHEDSYQSDRKVWEIIESMEVRECERERKGGRKAEEVRERERRERVCVCGENKEKAREKERKIGKR